MGLDPARKCPGTLSGNWDRGGQASSRLSHQSHHLWLSAKKTPKQSCLAEGDGESKQNTISLSKGCPAGAGTRCTLGPSRDAQLTTPGLPSGKEGGGRPARPRGRTGAHPSRQPFREALAARACSDASCLRGCGWGGEGVAGGQPGRGQQAGPCPAWLRGRGTSLGHTGRDRPGVLTPSPGPLLPRDRMLDVQAGRVDRASSSWGREGHVPGWGCWGREGGCK